jgi:UPF0755 protein
MAKKSKRGSVFTKGLLLVAVAAAAVLAILYALTTKSKPKPGAFTSLEIDASTGAILYEVPPKVSLQALSEDLESKGLVPNAKTFKYFLRLSGQDKKIRAGYYYVKTSNSVLEMVSKLTAGKQATRAVTIPEGKASWEIYSILKTYYPLDSLAFDSLVQSAEFATACRVEAPTLEGFLFPDTYVLPWKMSERDILKVMVRRFHEATSTLPPESTVIKNYGTVGWVTLASIVEKESALPAEQELIAGVFYNRLLQGWTLGADPTVRFARHKPTGPLLVSDLEVNSPYNTRRFAGLPPGPICNPGRGALQAALNPMHTDKMFFVAREDGSRGHYFSVDNREHMHYKAMASANRENRGQALPDETVSRDSAKVKKKSPPPSSKTKPKTRAKTG